jgi:hypothetical protein
VGIAEAAEGRKEGRWDKNKTMKSEGKREGDSAEYLKGRNKRFFDHY